MHVQVLLHQPYLYLAHTPAAPLTSLEHSRHTPARMLSLLCTFLLFLWQWSLCLPSQTYTETLKGQIPHSKMQQLPQLMQTSSLASLLPTGLRSMWSLYFWPSKSHSAVSFLQLGFFLCKYPQPNAVPQRALLIPPSGCSLQPSNTVIASGLCDFL